MSHRSKIGNYVLPTCRKRIKLISSPSSSSSLSSTAKRTNFPSFLFEDEKEKFRQVLEKCTTGASSPKGRSENNNTQIPTRIINHRAINNRIEIKTSNGNDYQDIHVRTCLSSRYSSSTEKEEESSISHTIHTGMHLAFLGTASSNATTTRNTSAAALRCGGRTLLFDVGEGFHKQMLFSTLSPAEIATIFITHLHGDHIFGLPSLLLDLNIKAKQKNNQCQNTNSSNNINTSMSSSNCDTASSSKGIHIYGPPGIFNYIAMNLVLSCSKFDTLSVVVHELVGGKAERGPNYWRQRNAKNPFTGHYPEFANILPTLRREAIPMKSDGTWTLEQPTIVTKNLVQQRMEYLEQKRMGKFLGIVPRLPHENNAGEHKQMIIQASEVQHRPGIQTFGYVVEELPPPPNIDPVKAMALGLAPSPKYSILKYGFPVQSDDGTRDIFPEQVLLPPVRGRKFAIVGDNYRIPPPMAELCHNADMLVHEATFLTIDKDANKKKETYGHSTAFMAGQFAHAVHAKVLVLNHFGGAVTGEELVQQAVTEARKGNKDTSRIIASNDFMEILIPKGGYKFPLR